MLAKADVCTPLSVMVGLVRHEIAVGAVTLIAELPLLPSEVAVIVADPATSPVTSPLPFTLATAAALLAHVTTRPDSAFPLASFGVAASCTVPPTRSEEHTSELQSLTNLVCRLLLEKKK